MASLTPGILQKMPVSMPFQETALRRATQVVLVILAIWLLTLIAMQLWVDRLSLNAELPARPPLQARERWSWFSGSQQPEIQGDYGELKNASIKAELLGVVISGASSTATMSVAGSSEAVYRIGDKLGSGVEIREIEPFRVVVWQNGQLRQIPLNRAGDDQSGDSSATVVSSTVSTGRGFSLAGMFAATPMKVENYDTGFKLRDLSPELTDLADLKENDVVVMVNGNSIGDMVEDPSMWMSLIKETSVPVVVLRDGEELEIYVNAASLSTRVLPRLDSRVNQMRQP